ncbi:MAG: anti-sigma factor [Caulobacteraceae bacterium]
MAVDEEGDGPILAAELALGVLDPPERVAAEARAKADPDFAAQVEAWRERFAPLLEEIAPQSPTPAAWMRIEAALGEPLAPRSPVARRRGLASPGALRDFARAAPSGWRFATFGAAAASLVWIAILIGLNPSRSEPTMTAALAPAAGARPYWIATLDRASGELRITPAASEPPDTRTRELWLIPAGGRPLPVGLFAPDKTGSLRLTAGLRAKAKAKATLAVSLEPPGGSPTGAPTGPVIATGGLKPV